MTNEKITDRIKKLLAMADADNGASEQERETALRRANSLMDKYNISMLDVSEAEQAEDERGKDTIHTGTVKWKAMVITMVGKLYGVFVYRTTGKHGKTFIVGRESSRVAVKYISEYLIHSICAEAKKMDGDRAYKNAFRLGAALAVSRTVGEIITERDRAARQPRAAGSEIAIVDHYNNELTANRSLAMSDGTRFSSGGGSSYSSRAGMEAGRAYGSGLSVNPQMSSGRRALPSK